MKTCSIEIVTFTGGERLHTVTNGTLEEHPPGVYPVLYAGIRSCMPELP